MTQGRLDWTDRADYIRNRSQRRPGDTDIEPAWTNEAWNDPDAIWYEPDPASKSGEAVRVIGYSPTARMVIVIIALPKQDHWAGMSAWKANRSYQRRYWEGQ